MRKIISFMHISLDGFVAGLGGEMDWIKVDEEIFDHVGKRISQGDTAMYGRLTYQMMENYWPTAADKPTATKHDIEHSKWYGKVHKVVLSKTMKDSVLPSAQAAFANTSIINENLMDHINELNHSALKVQRFSLQGTESPWDYSNIKLELSEPSRL
ncbi:MAG: dihydrofolate reductase family protein [Arenibacter algicola]